MAVSVLALLAATATTAGVLGFEPVPESLGRVELRVASGGEWDTNAKRSVSLDETSDDAPADGLVRLLVDASGELAFTRSHSISAGYTLGAKRFFRQGTEDLLAHDLSLATRHALHDRVSAGLSATLRASRTRSGARDYSLGLFGATLVVDVLDELSIEGNGGYLLFEFPTEHRFDYRGPKVGAAVTFRPRPSLSIEARADYILRRYDSNGLVALTSTIVSVEPMVVFCDSTTELSTGLTCTLRRDRELQLSVGATYRAGILVGGQYLARLQRSTSSLENVDRHRFTAFATVGLPLGLTLSGLAALQFNVGVSLTDNRGLGEDDENQNSLQVQLRRALFEGLSIEARYALFANRFSTAAASFTRHTAYLGVSYRVGLFEGDLEPPIGYESPQ